jgi:hypothetical protein
MKVGEINMNLQENISRIKSMMGLNEVSNPYSITWLEPTRGREGNEYTLIGGHKRSTIADQLNVPISVWFINLSE